MPPAGARGSRRRRARRTGGPRPRARRRSVLAVSRPAGWACGPRPADPWRSRAPGLEHGAGDVLTLARDPGDALIGDLQAQEQAAGRVVATPQIDVPAT